MNKIIAVICLSLLGARIFAAGLQDAAGIAWSASPADVVQTFKSHAGVKLVSQTGDHVVFKGGAIGGMAVREWRFDFNSGKLANVTAQFRVRQGSDAKGFLANQDFARLRAALDRTNGASKAEKGKNFEACTWRPANPAQTMRLYHGWTLGVKDSSTMALTLSPRG